MHQDVVDYLKFIKGTSRLLHGAAQNKAAQDLVTLVRELPQGPLSEQGEQSIRGFLHQHSGVCVNLAFLEACALAYSGVAGFFIRAAHPAPEIFNAGMVVACLTCNLSMASTLTASTNAQINWDQLKDHTGQLVKDRYVGLPNSIINMQVKPMTVTPF